MAIEAFIRFQDKEQNEVHYGQVTQQQLSSNNLLGATVGILKGDPFSGFQESGETRTISQILCPLESVPIFSCVGLNYGQHAKEADLKVPSYPVVFTKPPDALAGKYSPGRCHLNKRLMNCL